MGAPNRDAADAALQEYLDLLLQPAAPAPVDSRPYAEPAPRRPLPPLAPAVERRVAPAVARPVVEEIAVAAPVVVPVAEVAPVLESSLVVVEQVAVEVEAAADDLPSADPVQPPPWAGNGRPQWAQQRFEALLFTVGGLNLAVPLVELGAIHALEERELTPIFGQVDWFLGLLPLKTGALRVVDTAKVVMPERYDAAMPLGYRYVITLNGSDWGLGVDTIHDSVQLEPEAVRWRSARGKRPWLAGTVVEQMCALLDASQLTWMFHTLDRRRGGAKGAGAAPRL